MSGIFDNVKPLTDAEAAALPPLVAKGEDREAVIERIVEGWTTSFGKDAPRDHVDAGGLVVEEKAFVDANTGEAIDLGEIVRRVEARLTALHGEDGAAPETHIILKRCRIDVCDCSGLRVRPRWTAFAVTFGDGVDFREATFGDGANFSAANFSDRAYFGEATFGDWADFSAAAFGDDSGFDHAVLSTVDFSWVTANGLDLSTAEFGRPRGRNPLRRFSAFLRNSYGWHVVRSLGALSILTKVSYLSLLIVPLLAGGWPAVRAAVNHYNEAITESALVYEAAAAELEGVLERVAPSSESADLVESKRALTAHVQRIQADLGELTLPLRDLPIGFVLAFFAAFFVAAGHFVYQLAAPEALREESERDFVERVTTRFRELRETQRVDFLTRAMEYLKRIADELPETQNKNLVRRHGETVWVPSEIETLEKAVGTRDVAVDSAAREPGDSEDVDEEGASSKPAEVAARVDLEDIVVEEGARAEYELIARQSKGWAAVAGVLYGAGVFFVVWLVWDQIRAVALAAGVGWIPTVMNVVLIIAVALMSFGLVAFLAWCVAYYTPLLRRRLSRWMPGGGTRRSGPRRIRCGWDWLVRERD